MSTRIFLGDDSSTIQKVLKIAFSAYDVDITIAESWQELENKLGSGRAELVVVDCRLPGVKSQLEIADIPNRFDRLPTLVLLSSSDKWEIESPDIEILRKPFAARDLVGKTESLLGKRLDRRSSLDDLPAPPLRPRSEEKPRVVSEPVVTVNYDDDFEDEPAVSPPRLRTDEKKGQPAFPDRLPPPPTKISHSDNFREPQFDRNQFEYSDWSDPVAEPALSAKEPSRSFNMEEDELIAIIEKKVTEYCHENFRDIAREILREELSKLAEKTLS